MVYQVDRGAPSPGLDQSLRPVDLLATLPAQTED